MEEKELIEKLKANDRDAFSWFVDEYRPAVVRTCFGFLRNDDEALDVAQDVFVEVFGAVQNFRGDAKLSTWLFRIAVNRSLDQLRHRNRQKRMSQLTQVLKIGQNDVAERVACTTTATDNVENADRQRALNLALAKLPENQRVAFTLSNYEDLSYQQIADVMNVSVSAVESLIFRARTNMKKYLTRFYEENLN